MENLQKREYLIYLRRFYDVMSRYMQKVGKNEFEKNLETFIQYYKGELKKLHALKEQIDGDGPNILSEFLEYLGIPNTKSLRFSVYDRLVNIKEDTLKMELGKMGFSSEELNEKMSLAYDFVANFHLKMQNAFIDFAKKEDLFTEFYFSIIEGVYKVGEKFSRFYKAWHKHIILTQNVFLEEKFENNGDKIIEFLEKNNLFDKGYNGERAERTYSGITGFDNGDNLRVETYATLFPSEIADICKKLEELIHNLEKKEDEIYESKTAYIDYFSAIKNAFLETDRNKTLLMWAEVDRAWMEIKTPIQVSHPLEYYEDIYRKAVAPEWDIRFEDKMIMDSESKNDILSLYEKLFTLFGKDTYASSYHFSLQNINRVQLYISQPIFYFGNEFVKMFSAQVVPNDEIVSKEEGKKIFAFPEFVFSGQKNSPIMTLQVEIMGRDFVERYRSIFEDEKKYYAVYDIETIGHEYGHTLWLDVDTEMQMGKTGNFKNIEEWKATAGGLCAYFESGREDSDDVAFILHIDRCVKLQKYREIEEIFPYYCESIIHLTIMFKTSMLVFDGKKLRVDMTKKEETKKLYLEVYQSLALHYLEKKDASLFLSQYTTKEGKIFFAKDEKVKTFCDYYFKRYKDIGSEVFEG